MLPVSNDYLVDMAKLIRNYSNVIIEVPLSNKTAVGAFTVGAGGGWNYGATILNDFQPASEVTSNYFESFESDDDGLFSPTFPSLAFTFATAVPTIDGLAIQFDPAEDRMIKKFRIRVWHSDNTYNDYEYEINSTLLPNGIFNFQVDISDVKLMQVTVMEAAPHTNIRIFGVVMQNIFMFDNNNVSSVETETEIDQISRRLPTETCSFVVLDYDGQYDPDNPNGVWRFFEEKQPFTVQYGYLLDDGTWEWLDKTNYVLTGSPQKNGFDVTFSGTKLLSTLTGTYRKGVFNQSKETLMNLAKSVLGDAGIVDYSGLDNALNNISTVASLPIATHAECLQLIAQAGNCLLYTGSDGRICIKSGWYPSSLLGNENIDYETQLQFPVIDITPPLKVETVKQYRYVPKVASETLVDQTMDIIGTASVWIDYDLSTDQSATVSGGTLVSAQYYGRCAYLTITGSGTVTVQITGKPIVSYSSSTDYAIGTTGDQDTFDNELIDNSVLQYEVAQYRANYLKNRNAYTLNYRGNPELECSDVVGFETEYADNLVGVVVSTKISYNGALGGELILKKLDSYLDYYYADSELYSGESLGVI